MPLHACVHSCHWHARDGDLASVSSVSCASVVRHLGADASDGGGDVRVGGGDGDEGAWDDDACCGEDDSYSEVGVVQAAERKKFLPADPH